MLQVPDGKIRCKIIDEKAAGIAFRTLDVLYRVLCCMANREQNKHEKNDFPFGYISVGSSIELREFFPIGPVKQSFFCVGDLPDRLWRTAKRLPEQKEVLAK